VKKQNKYDLVLDFDKFWKTEYNRIGVAVSGGSDSIALLNLVFDWAKSHNKIISAVTVNHNLRDGVEGEIKLVSDFCYKLSIPYSVLSWEGWDKKGNLQAEARRARYRLISDWAILNKIDVVAVGHTKDDVIENFIIRLSRGSGVDGLSQMLSVFKFYDVNYVRPLLDLGRSELREYLNFKKVTWVDDPSNENSKFHRVKVRKMLSNLKGMGVNIDNIADSSKHLRRSREALESYTEDLAKKCIEFREGDIIFGLDIFLEIPLEVQRRLLIKALKFMGNLDFGPRAKEVKNLINAFQDYRSHTLGGYHFHYSKGFMRMSREYEVIATLQTQPNQTWDDRWFVSGPDSSDFIIKPLGQEGLKCIPNWRDSGIPRLTLISSPSVWKDRKLELALLIEESDFWELRPLKQEKDFFIDNKVLNH
jgi:tRNA(Ile)-lysidine synthase